MMQATHSQLPRMEQSHKGPYGQSLSFCHNILHVKRSLNSMLIDPWCSAAQASSPGKSWPFGTSFQMLMSLLEIHLFVPI